MASSANVPPAASRVRIGLALGGGFSGAIADIGVLLGLEQADIRISAIAGISAGAIVAAPYASGATLEEISAIAASMRFSDVARWSMSKMGLGKSRRMAAFLRRLLRQHRFERMRMPLAVVATDLVTESARSSPSALQHRHRSRAMSSM